MVFSITYTPLNLFKVGKHLVVIFVETGFIWTSNCKSVFGLFENGVGEFGIIVSYRTTEEFMVQYFRNTYSHLFISAGILDKKMSTFGESPS